MIQIIWNHPRRVSIILATSRLRSTVGLQAPVLPKNFPPPRPRQFPERSTLQNYRLYFSTMEKSPPTDPVTQLVQYSGKEYQAVKEGQAYILNPPAEAAASQGPKKVLKPDDESQSVFYNPIQQFNRDLSVLAIKAYGEHVLALKREKNEKRKRKNKGNAAVASKKRKRENDEHMNAQNDDGDCKTIATEEDSKSTSVSHPGSEPSSTFTILDALSATGLRALRYASEIPFISSVVANDLSPSAIQSMKVNIEYNQLEKLIHPNHGDARLYMYSRLNPAGSHNYDSGKFDVIDLDPYGTAVPFLDAAVQSVKDGGLLCVTCTDAAIWASYGYPEKSYSLYGGIPIRGTHCHEGGLRLILNALASSAAKYGLAIEPLLSLSIDFYARCFVRIHHSPAEVKFISGNTMLVYNCDSGCGAWTTQPLTQTKKKQDKKGNLFYHFASSQGPISGPKCDQCGFKTHVAGPMWAGPLHNPHFIQKILDSLPGVDKNIYKTVDRIEGMLTTALEEDLSLDDSSDDTSPSTGLGGEDGTAAYKPSPIIPRVDPALKEPYPFYFNISALSRVLRTCTVPADAFRGALRHLGYRCSRSHTKPNTTRTDAPWSVIWEVMREWVRQKSPIKEGALKPGTAGAGIMSKGREGTQVVDEEDQRLIILKKELLSATETGKDLADLVTKVEAVLHRSGSRQVAGRDLNSEVRSKGDLQSTTILDPPTSHQHQGPSIPRSEGNLEVVFDESLGHESHPCKRLVRYQINPRANWGPLNRASGGTR